MDVGDGLKDPTEVQTRGGPQPFAKDGSLPAPTHREIAAAQPTPGPAPEPVAAPAAPEDAPAAPPAQEDRFDEDSLVQAGFSPDEIGQEKKRQAQEMADAGFTVQEINRYFGVQPEPDMDGVKKFVDKNISDWKTAKTPENGAEPQVAHSFMDAFLAGLQMSTAGLAARNKMPDVVVPENAGMAMRIVSQAGTLAGDLPAMVAGGVFGAAAGSEVPVLGTAAGAAGGAWAAPAAIRKAYIDHIQKGDIQDFGDFFERTAAIAWEAAKGATVGIATAGVGGAVGGKLAETALTPLAQTGGVMAAELATMTTVGKAMENEVPKPSDFVEGALLLGALHGTTKLTGKLQTIYAETGLKPHQVIEQANVDPVLKGELLSSKEGTPESLKKFVEKQPNEELLGLPEKPKVVEAKATGERSDVLSPDFSPDVKPKIELPPDEEKPMVDAKTAILSRIAGEAEPEKPTLKQRFQDLKRGALDDVDPVKRLVDGLTGEKPLPTLEDPVALLRESRAYQGMAETVVDHGPLRFKDSERTGSPGLKEILKPFKGDLEGVQAYWVAAHSLEMEERGLDTGVPQGPAKEFVEKNRDKYDKAVKQIVNFANENFKYAADSGIVSKDLYEQSVKKWDYYMPTNRALEDNSPVGGKGAGRLTQKKAKEGSDLLLQDPLETLIKNTFTMLRESERNRAKTALVDLASRTVEGAEMVKKSETVMKPITVTEYEVQKYFNEHGIDANPEAFTIFRALAQPVAKDEIGVFRDGKLERYRVGEDVARAFGALDYQVPNKLLKIMQIPAKMIRVGAVDTPDFLARHGIRDTFNAFAYSKNGFIPLYDNLRGLSAWFTESKPYQDWLAGGGGQSNFMSMDKNYLQKKVFELSKDTGLIDKAWNVVKNPLDLAHVMAEAVVSAPRIGEFIRAQEAGKDIRTAAMDSRNVTIDNQRSGSDPAIKALSMISAFWNTRLQGSAKLFETLADAAKGNERAVKTIGKFGLAITLPSVLLWMKNHDDPRYKELPEWQKDLFWIVLTKDHVFRIPKPFEAGILFGSLPERMLDSFYDQKPEAFKGFGRAVVEGALPFPQVNAVTPVIEQLANRSMLTGQNLVPKDLEHVAPEYQYTGYTSETAKQLGKMIAQVPGSASTGPKNLTLASPIIIQNYIRAWTGGMGMYALQLADKGLRAAGVAPPKVEPAATLADIPFVKAFVVRYPSASAASIQEFYDKLDQAKTAHETVQSLVKRGDLKAAYSFMNSPSYQEHMAQMTETAKTLGQQSGLIRRIYADPKMTPNDKRQLIDGAYYRMIQEARQGVERMRQVEQIAKEMEKSH